ncbi:hypothetical protein LINPERHAP2_LOCUS24578 [Linum perenne]
MRGGLLLTLMAPSFRRTIELLLGGLCETLKHSWPILGAAR